MAVNDKVVIITGRALVIGRSNARQFASRGAEPPVGRHPPR